MLRASNDAYKVQLYAESCPPVADLVRKLERRPSRKLGYRGYDPEQAGYAAGAWHRLFIITLKRLAVKNPSLARITAAEALNVLEGAALSSSYPHSAAGRRLVKMLRKMGRRTYGPGELSPRSGIHPDVLELRVRQAFTTFKDSQGAHAEAAAMELWQRWDRRGKIPADVLEEIRAPHVTATAKAHALAGAASRPRLSADSVRRMLTRHRKRTRG